ncbi:hypothetical protein G3580_12810 [Nitrogeniibacter mangrovi]|uniref:CENP-V/GFA domain-containing protein n=1 Tax=Nitrogeniibacter mangrovi TaxID=2016596 RepID=A0A6C1B4S5_9RHOO|nr:DUF6151 family protein [Nitrogeniibacter mangrovi]QID18433.1 hypothetical protein G3580_12810 [Nitrogeniibacter mangrovi]
MHDVELSCRCGQVKGRATSIDPREGTRVVCYCKDCQAFARVLEAEASVLDACGGTDIYQLPPARLRLDQGQDRVRCLRLSAKGLYRWYAGCCNTPIGNTVSRGIPVVGLIHAFIADPAAETTLGPVRAYVNTQSATGALPEAIARQSSLFPYVVKIVRKMLVWKLTGQGRPSPFFDPDGKPLSTPQIVAPGER